MHVAKSPSTGASESFCRVVCLSPAPSSWLQCRESRRFGRTPQSCSLRLRLYIHIHQTLQSLHARNIGHVISYNIRIICREGLRMINPRRSCAEGFTVLVLSVCLSVCVSVCYHSSANTLLVSTLKVRYVGVYPRLFSLFYSWIFD